MKCDVCDDGIYYYLCSVRLVSTPRKNSYKGRSLCDDYVKVNINLCVKKIVTERGGEGEEGGRGWLLFALLARRVKSKELHPANAPRANVISDQSESKSSIALLIIDLADHVLQNFGSLRNDNCK